jgi:hypothetical protein
VFSIGRPINTNSAIRFCFSNLIRLLYVGEIPEVHLACQVTKTSNHGNLREWANFDSVPVPFAELKQGVAIFVI